METGHSVVLVAGGAPYLGGSETWAPLRERASAYHFVEIDPLRFADAPDIEAAAFTTVDAALHDAAAVVAHYSSAAIVLESAARLGRDLPILLISPLLMLPRTRRAVITAAVLALLPLGSLMTVAAKSKAKRLKIDRNYVREQLRIVIPDTAISERLLDQAQLRCRDPLTDRQVERTAEAIRLTFRALSEPAQAMLAKATLLVGTDAIGRGTVKQFPARVIEGNGSCAMIESPQAVADLLHAMIAERVARTTRPCE
jgi:hypothetical protein